MTELIAHEVQISLTTCTDGIQTDHLVKSDRTVDSRIMASFIHICVHIGTCQTEDHRLITNQRLVVALYISHCTLSRTSHTHIAPHTIDMPAFVCRLFDSLHPHIRHTHSKTIVKADTTILDRETHTRHTGHILCHSDRFRIYLTDQFIGEL